jgi:hypothetical protein
MQGYIYIYFGFEQDTDNIYKNKCIKDSMKDFDVEKKKCLNKLYLPDRSRKGEVDEPIIPLIEYINALENIIRRVRVLDASCSLANLIRSQK